MSNLLFKDLDEVPISLAKGLWLMKYFKYTVVYCKPLESEDESTLNCEINILVCLVKV